MAEETRKIENTAARAMWTSTKSDTISGRPFALPTMHRTFKVGYCVIIFPPKHAATKYSINRADSSVSASAMCHNCLAMSFAARVLSRKLNQINKSKDTENEVIEAARHISRKRLVGSITRMTNATNKMDTWCKLKTKMVWAKGL